MSDTVLTVEEAARCLDDLVERIHNRGEAALLLKSGKPVARIVAVADRELVAVDLIAFLRQWRIDYPDADEQFAEAIEQSRQAVQPPHDPWD